MYLLTEYRHAFLLRAKPKAELVPGQLAELSPDKRSDPVRPGRNAFLRTNNFAYYGVHGSKKHKNILVRPFIKIIFIGSLCACEAHLKSEHFHELKPDFSFSGVA